MPTCEPFLKTLYPVTATLSVEAIQDKLICDEEETVAANPVGVIGAFASNLKMLEDCAAIPAKFDANTVKL